MSENLSKLKLHLLEIKLLNFSSWFQKKTIVNDIKFYFRLLRLTLGNPKGTLK